MTDRLTPGPELDAAVAGAAMQWRMDEDGFWLDTRGGYAGWKDPARSRLERGERPWAPSVDPASAWEVVRRLQSLYTAGFELSCSDPTRPDPWIAVFRSRTYQSEARASGESAPLAICRAAIRAMEETP